MQDFRQLSLSNMQDFSKVYRTTHHEQYGTVTHILKGLGLKADDGSYQGSANVSQYVVPVKETVILLVVKLLRHTDG